MDEVTQRTAASAEESAAASEELSAQSQVLKAAVDQLQALVGSDPGYPAASQEPIAARRPPAARPVQNTRRLQPGAAALPKPASALTGAIAGRAAEFPLDDSEFKEF
jgi:hypothetical protein